MAESPNQAGTNRIEHYPNKWLANKKNKVQKCCEQVVDLLKATDFIFRIPGNLWLFVFTKINTY
jgi:hypothetical protein